MASTSAPISNLISGYTELPGLRVGPQGGIMTQMKIYNFGITDVREITATSTSGSYSVSGLSTNDIPVMLVPSTGNNTPSTALRANVGNAWVSASNTLEVSWTGRGTSTSMSPGLAAPGAAWTLMTMSYYNQSPSTTT